MDFDSDGLTDILSGSWPGELYFFRRQSDGTFAKGENILDAEDKPIKLGSASVVFAADWEGDGDLDLLVGDIQGNVFLVPNEGTSDKPSFGKGEPLSAGDKPIRVGGDSGPVVADWDGDGRADLVVGAGDGSVVWFRNTAEEGQPVLAEGRSLVAPTKTRVAREAEEAPLACGSRTKVCVTDYDGDGLLDLLVGDFGYQSIRNPEVTVEEKANEEAVRKEYQELIARYREIYIEAPIEFVRTRDDKGLYAAAAEGRVTNVVGIDILWIPPPSPDLVIDATRNTPPNELALRIADLDPVLKDAVV